MLDAMSDPDHKPLYWDASYEIVLSLIEHHPDADLDRVGLDELCDWIVALPGFADEQILANDDLLTDILRDWYEEASEAS